MVLKKRKRTTSTIQHEPKRRKRSTRFDCIEGKSKHRLTTVKSALGSICKKHKNDGETTLLPSSQTLKELMRNTSQAFSQLTLIASLVMKHHVISTISNGSDIPFDVDNIYCCRVLKAILDKINFQQCSYTDSLLQSVKAIQGFETIQLSPLLSGTAIDQLCRYVSTEMATSWTNLLSIHLERSLRIWLKNQLYCHVAQHESKSISALRWRNDIRKRFQSIIQSVSEEFPELQTRYHNHKQFMQSCVKPKSVEKELNNWLKLKLKTIMAHQQKCNLKEVKQKDIQIYFDQILQGCSTVFVELQEEYKQREKESLKAFWSKPSNAEDEEDFTFDYKKCLKCMYTLRKETEDLEIQHNVSLKQISFIPQAQFHVRHLRWDSKILASVYKGLYPESKIKLKDLYSPTYQDLLWGEFFDLNKIRKLRKQGEFVYSISTNGHDVSVPFQLFKRDSDAKPKKDVYKLHELKPGMYSEKKVLVEKKDLHDFQYIGVDPGVRNVLAWTDMSTLKGKKLTQQSYRHQSFMHDYQARMKRWYDQNMTNVQQDLSSVPYCKTSHLSRLDQYVECLKRNWNQSWNFYHAKRLSKWKFESRKQKQKFMDKLVNIISLSSTSPPKVVIYGNGGKSGQFIKLKGGGFKGPTCQIRKLLAKKSIVICADEFRTSQNCLNCGYKLSHPCRSVSTCANKSLGCQLNGDRDLLSSQAIACRSLSVMLGNIDMGRFSRSVKSEENTEWQEGFPGLAYTDDENNLKTILRWLSLNGGL